MKTFCHRRFSPFNLYLFSAISLFCLISLSNIQVMAQDDDPPEIINKIPKHIPLKVELENKEKKEVIKELRIKVTNTSNRAIYKLNLFLTVLDVLPPDGNKYGYSLIYGTYRRGEPLDVRAQSDDTRLEPGESYVFQVKKELAEMFKKSREKRNEPYPKKFEIEFHYLIFGDGTGFLDTSGSPFPDKPKTQSNLIAPSLSKLPFPLQAFGYRKARESPPCGNSRFNQSQAFSNSLFSTPNLLYLISDQNNSEDYPCCYSGGNDCTQARLVPLNQDCCVKENGEVSYTIKNTLDLAPGYSCQPGYSCKKFSFRNIECKIGGYDPFYCQEPVLEDCGSPPNPTPTPTPTPTATPTPTPDHLEGAEGYEYECSDKDLLGDPLDNDGNGKANCEESNCTETEHCRPVCDRDGDRFIARSCGGNDCRDDNEFIPRRDPLTRELLPENLERICSNGDDDDCDDLRDEADPDCNSSGGGYVTDYAMQCYGEYMVTTTWISYDGGKTWTFMSDTWEFIGISCGPSRV